MRSTTTSWNEQDALFDTLAQDRPHDNGEEDRTPRHRRGHSGKAHALLGIEDSRQSLSFRKFESRGQLLRTDKELPELPNSPSSIVTTPAQLYSQGPRLGSTRSGRRDRDLRRGTRAVEGARETCEDATSSEKGAMSGERRNKRSEMAVQSWIDWIENFAAGLDGHLDERLDEPGDGNGCANGILYDQDVDVEELYDWYVTYLFEAVSFSGDRFV